MYLKVMMPNYFQFKMVSGIKNFFMDRGNEVIAVSDPLAL